ncbi:MAG: type IX secretion system sortase PorU [Dysgonamonadaceae bacterium]|jgi:hypothetical protein|nr:type IX secretion system sortase PorU [Dysgonamonadaceae bacterium]
MKNKIKYYALLILVSVFVFSQAIFSQVKNDGSRYAKTSRLASGKWIKLKTPANAIYKLSFDDIKKMGISDPSKVKIYGSGGWILDEDFSEPYVDDLQEIAVYVNKGSDEVFNSGDFLLFYGRGTVKWTYETDAFVHENNPYATYGAYFMTEGDSGPKEMKEQASVTQTTVEVSEYDDYALYELDSVTIANTGRELFGESFVARSVRTFEFNIPGITSAGFTLSFAALAPVRSALTLTANNDLVISDYIYPLDYYANVLYENTHADGYVKAALRSFSGTWNDPVEKISANISYEVGNQTVAFLNFIRLNTTRKLQAYGNDDPFFRNVSSKDAATRFKIENAGSDHVVFDITDPYNARKINAALSGTQLSFGAEAGDTIREYAVVDLSKSFHTPELLEEVQNQDLHGLEQTDMVILTPKNFLVQAETLAKAHREKSGLRVTVVQADLVFNEFSSGIPDATAYRRFMKMFYDRGATEQEKPKYLLFFGDGVFDNRFKTPGGSKLQKENYLLTYQFKESVDEHESYGTEDYFGLLDDDEGVNFAAESLDIGIGRFPVSSMSQADFAVAKVIAYMNNTQHGSWKNSLVFVADDRNTEESIFLHSIQSDSLAKKIDREYPEFVVSKVYEPAFKSVVVNGKKTYPDAKNKMMTALKNGCFLLNYTGHGNTTSWTSEDLLTIADVNQMSFENLPLWITATCDFGWFDGVDNSAGEAAFLNKKSGAIALYTTSRVVLAMNNLDINYEILSVLFDKENRKKLRLGDILRLSKNRLSKSDTNKLNYVLLGDPALQLNFPDYEIQVSTVNGKPVKKDEVLQFKALENITLTGQIVDVHGTVQTGLNGTSQTLIFDSEQQLKSLDPDNQPNPQYLEFKEYTSMIYPSVSNDVVNGEFTVEFTVPLDIFYSDNKGKLNFYAHDETNNKEAHGSFIEFVLNGTVDNPDNDGKGPEIRSMYLNSSSFKNGDKVNQTPFFMAEVYDKDGINVSNGSIGHEISICVDNNPTYTFSLNSYFVPSQEEKGAGRVGFLIPKEKALPEGNHTLVLKVWDLLNNSGADSIRFTVVKDLKPQLFDLTATNNPARVNTFFELSHDRPDAQIEVTIRVYDLTGRICWTNKVTGSSGWLKNFPVEWNLRTSSGMPLKAGIYVYKAEIRSGNSSEATKAKKIIILGQ